MEYYLPGSSKPVMNVIHKPTGETRCINAHKFNPSIHTKTSATAKTVKPKGENEKVVVGSEESAPVNEEKELRAKAKALGIKSWHVKSVNKLIAEIAEIAV